MIKINKSLLDVSIYFFLLMALWACGKGEKDKDSLQEKATETPITLQDAPIFDADSSFAFLKAQVDFGARVPNTQAHKQCGDYLEEQLRRFGWEVMAQEFEAYTYNKVLLKSRNIIASYNTSAPTRILLAAHWDTRPFNDKEVKDSTQYQPIAGANDGASGVAVLLEIARTIQNAQKKPDIGIDIIFFDSEDYGQPEDYAGEWQPDQWCLGSQHWAKNKHKENYTAYYGILLDMVGAKNAKFYREGYSQKYAPSINAKVWQIAQKLGFGAYFISKDSPAIIDDHYYVNTLASIPMIDIVDYDPMNQGSFFPSYHHTSKDDLDIIDKNTLKAVGQTVVQVLYNEAVAIQ